MTASPKKTIQFTPEEWKKLVLVNVKQLHDWLENVPGNTETGRAALTEEHLQLIGGHLSRTYEFLIAWSKSRVDVPPTAVEMPEEAASQDEATEAEPVEPRKGGWPKGKPRKARDAEAA